MTLLQTIFTVHESKSLSSINVHGCYNGKTSLQLGSLSASFFKLIRKGGLAFVNWSSMKKIVRQGDFARPLRKASGR
jgi:hypothetical protein